jgi:hypothetical protein
VPAELAKAHRALDRVVDVAHRKKAFDTERQRLAYLFTRYQQLVAPLMNQGTTQKQSKKRRDEPYQSGYHYQRAIALYPVLGPY